MKSINGYTLIEVLVATGIFVLIGLASYRVLSTQIQAFHKLEDTTKEIHDFQNANRLMTSDLLQLSNRAARSDENIFTPAIFGTENQLIFTRTGWANFKGEKRPESQRVLYFFRNNSISQKPIKRFNNTETSLIRRNSTYIDIKVSSRLFKDDQYETPYDSIDTNFVDEKEVFTHITNASFQYIDSTGKQHNEWPTKEELNYSTSSEKVYLKSIVININTKNIGSFSRIFEVPNGF